MSTNAQQVASRPRVLLSMKEVIPHYRWYPFLGLFGFWVNIGRYTFPIPFDLASIVWYFTRMAIVWKDMTPQEQIALQRWQRSYFKAVFVWLFSLVLHAGMIAGFIVILMFVTITKTQGSDNSPEAAAVTQVEEENRDADLTNIDIGSDPTLQLNYNVDRIEDVSVPGPVDPTAAVGIPGAPEAMRQNVPAPPGVGGGNGAGVPSLDAGTGAMFGNAGGYATGLMAAGGFGGRSGATREKMLREGGGNPESEATVAKGLLWLALHQAPDGHWALDGFHRYAHKVPSPSSETFTCNCTGEVNRQNDIAATAFALLPFLASGNTQKPSKDPKQVDYSKTVKAGLDYLVAKQGSNGYFGGDMYSHGIAAIAMCEAYGMTSDPMLKTPAQKAIRFIEAAQDPAGGGWRYSPRTPGDTSVTGWQVMALKSGQMAGLELANKGEVLKKAEKFMDSVESSSGGRYGYLPGSGETPVMTAVGMLCRQYMGVNPRNPGLLKGVEYLQQPAFAPGKTNNIYYEYYATQAMHHMGGDAWDYWNEGPGGKGSHTGIRDSLVARQDSIAPKASGYPGAAPPLPEKLAHQDGSWAPNGAWGMDGGGRIMYTSLSLLTLEVYYRHLPLYRKSLGVDKEMETGSDAPKEAPK